MNKILLFFTFFILFNFQSSLAEAREWTYYEDPNGLFGVKIPEQYTINDNSIRTSNSEISSSNEVSAIIDQRPYKDVVRNYIIRYEQTLADIIGRDQIADILKKDLKRYEDYYRSIDGKILDTKMNVQYGYPTLELIIAYIDEDKLKHVRNKILYTNTTRFEQTMIGEESDMFSFRTNEFFSSLDVKEGKSIQAGDFKAEWETYTSPFDLINVGAPFITPPFFTKIPAFTNNSNSEKIEIEFYDPIFKYKLFYNAYGYRLKKPVSEENVQDILMQEHLAKFKVNFRNMRIQRGKMGNFPLLRTQMQFAPFKKLPYLNTVLLQATYMGNLVVVQELVANPLHINSKFENLLMNNITFTPFKANLKQQTELKEQKSAQ